MSFDASEIRAFADEMERSASRTESIRPVLMKAGMNVKRDWQDALAGSPSFKGVKSTPSFDVESSPDGMEVEVGPRTSGRVPGDLVSIAHFGGARGGGGVTDPQNFLDAEAPRFEDALQAVVERLLP